MTVRVRDGLVELTGTCPAEEAEELTTQLLADPQAAVDWRACEHAHMTVIQVLFVAERRLTGPPRNAFLARWVEPLLRKS